MIYNAAGFALALGQTSQPIARPSWMHFGVGLRNRDAVVEMSYTPDAMKALLSQPEDRSAAAREVAESLGGKLLGFWYAFGEFDGVFLMEAPDNASAAALAMAVGAGGALSEVETTVLLDMDEAQDAMRKAAAATYRPPRS